MRDVYTETRLRVTCYMAKSTNEWIKVAWNREALKNENSMIDEAVATMAQLGADIQFEDNAVKLGGERIDAEWKPTWKKVKESFKKGREVKELKTTKTKNNRVSCLQNKNKNATFGFHRIWIHERLRRF